MREVLRTVSVLMLLGLMAASASAATTPSAFARSVSCKATEVTITYDGTKAVVRKGDTTLAQATRLARSVSSACARIARLGVYRQNLDKSPTQPRVTIVCRTGSFAKVEVEPVRSSSGRRIGSRLAVFGTGSEVAEAIITSKTKWFSWASYACHA
jgi:hypothetical protein